MTTMYTTKVNADNTAKNIPKREPAERLSKLMHTKPAMERTIAIIWLVVRY